MILIQQSKLIKRIFLLLLTVFLIKILTPLPSFQPNKNNNTIQGIWITHLGISLLSYTALLDNTFYQLSRLNFDRIYIDVYNGGVIYPSKYAPKNNKISFPGTNPLKAAIQEGKRYQLKIYAWYEHGMMMYPSDKLAQQHPDWLLTTINGQSIIENHVWLNPNHPEVVKYFTNLFLEVANNYPDLYGVQLDDHWGIPKAFGNQTNGMNQLTQKVFSTLKQAQPGLVISLSPNTYEFAYNNYSQDWLLWVKQKLVNEIIVQVYRSNTQELIDSLTNTGLNIALQYVPVAIGIYTGNFQSPKPLAELQQQLEVAKKYNYGYALFCWEYLFTPLHKSNNRDKEAIFLKNA